MKQPPFIPLQTTSPVLSRASVSKIFRKFDVDGSGKISVNNLLGLIHDIEMETMISFNEHNRDFIRNVALENPDLYLDENDIYSLVKKTFKSPMISDKAYTASAKRNILFTTIQTPSPIDSHTIHPLAGGIDNIYTSKGDESTKRVGQIENEFKLRKKEYEETIVEMEVKIGDLVKKNDFLEHELSDLQKQLIERSIKENTYSTGIQRVFT